MRQKEHEKKRRDLIKEIGPWALQSYPRDQWALLPDAEIIAGAILRALPEVKLRLKDVYDLAEIKAVWEDQVVQQDGWFHAANIWAAQNLFDAADPEAYVKKHFKASQNRLKKRYEFT